jgi:hypothetical protein
MGTPHPFHAYNKAETTPPLTLDDACLLVLKSVVVRARLDARGCYLHSLDARRNRTYRATVQHEAQAFLETFLETDG